MHCLRSRHWRRIALVTTAVLALTIATAQPIMGDLTERTPGVPDVQKVSKAMDEGSSVQKAGFGDVAIIHPPWGRAPHDSDHRVPEYYGCYAGAFAGKTHKTWSGGHVRAWIQYDTCAIRGLGAGPTDWARIKAHERAHARGFRHWGGTPQSNPAYYPVYRICHC